MDKIGIITLNGYYNYGNRLQNYALQNAIEQLGYECETIINKTYIKKGYGKDEQKGVFKKIANKDIKSLRRSIGNRLNKKRYSILQNSRGDIFKEFSYKHIKETKFEISCGMMNDLNICDYKYFVSGSDQVWNPNDPMVSEVNFMLFAPEEKRITYAPSFGVSDVPKEYREQYALWINGIKSLSVRESEGAEIISRLTGRVADVLIDPTMLISKDAWLSIAKKDCNKPEKKYLLTYFLGDKSKEVNKMIDTISKNYKLEIVNLANIRDEKYYLSGPSEFIDYINDAELFITDSFHGCVFSLLLDTAFIVCDREGQGENKMNSRIYNFLDKFHLKERHISVVEMNKLFLTNYDESYIKLELERIKSWRYLKDAFELQ